MAGLMDWLGVKRRQSVGDTVLLIAREITDRVTTVQEGLAEVRSPEVIDHLTEEDFFGLGQVTEEQAIEDPEYAVVLARLVFAAAKAKQLPEETVDAALRLDALLEPGAERDRLLREAYQLAERSGYVVGGRTALSRLGLRAIEAGDTERARQTIEQQLALGDVSMDGPSEVAAAMALGDQYRREGDTATAQRLYRRATQAAQRLDDPATIAEALVRQIEVLPRDTDLQTLGALQRQAADAARRTGNLALQSRIVLGLAETLWRNGKPDEAIAQLESGLTLAREIGDQSLEVRCRAALLEIERTRERLDVVADHERQIIAIEERLGNRTGTAEWSLRLGSTLLAMNRPDEAISVLRRARDMATALQDPQLEERALGGLGVATAQTGAIPEALQYLTEAMTVAHEAQDDRGEARWLTSIGETLWRAGDADQALKALNDGYAIARRIDDVELQATQLTLLGRIFVARGESPRAKECLNRALELNKRLGQRGEQIQNVMALAQLASETGQIGSATQLFEQGLHLATMYGDQASAARIQLRMGRLAGRRGDQLNAAEHFRQAATLADGLGQPMLAAQAWQAYATAGHALADPRTAEAYQKAIGLARSMGDTATEASMVVNLGLYLASAGRDDEAVVALRQGAAMASALVPPEEELRGRAEHALVVLGEHRRTMAEARARRDMPPIQTTFTGITPAMEPREDEVSGEATLRPE